jgi:arginine decarboxylase
MSEFLPTRLYLCAAEGQHKENKNARDRASAAVGLADKNLVAVSSVLPPGIRLITREEFDDLTSPGQIVFTIHGLCEGNVPGQRVSAALCAAVPDDPGVTGYVTEVYEHPGVEEGWARRRVETMALQLFAERNGDSEFVAFVADKAWQYGGTDYTVAGHALTLHTVSASAVANWEGHYACALVAAVLLP